MIPKMMHNAMQSVVEDMGRAAREGRARRFKPKAVAKHGNADMEVDPVVDQLGGPSPVHDMAHDISNEEMDELMRGEG